MASAPPDPAPLIQSAPPTGGGGAGQGLPTADLLAPVNRDPSNRLSLLAPSAADSAQNHGISAPWHPAAGPGGGAALPPRGGSGASNPTRVASRASTASARLPQSTPAANGEGNSAALLAAAASASASNGAGAGGAPGAGTGAAPTPFRMTGGGTSGPAGTGAGETTKTNAAPGSTADTSLGGSSGGATNAASTISPTASNASGPSQESFPYFPLYVLDVNDGVVLFPGVDQLANTGHSVLLQAQVSGTTVSSYNWNTSGISADATSISGGSTYQLSFEWNGPYASSHVDPITLSVTDSNSHIETYTYDFQLMQGGGTAIRGDGNATWPTSLSPDTISAADPAWTSDGVSVDPNSGVLDTSIPLPSYNPNVSANDLTYDSITANPLPIIIAENTLSSSSAVPTKVSATLTFNGTVGTTYYYNTSTLNPGDVQQIALQATSASNLSTGRYSYSVQIVDHGATNTTITYSGSTDLINQSSSAFGDGWTLDGLEQIFPVSGGVILSEGGGGNSLWFAGSFGSGGGTFTTPAGDFSTLVENSGGTFTRTLPSGDRITFNSGGYETATIDLNGLHTTYGYTSNRLTSITDSYSNVTSLTYNGSNLLQSIEDPALRFTTFTMSGGSLKAVEQADGSHITYTYDGSGRMTELEDPMAATVTIAYDSAERVGTITRPDLTTEKFSAYQEQGWTNSGTSGSPAPATLMAAAAAAYTDPNGNVTSLRPDWYGLGMTGVAVDALGDVATYDISSNGLPTVTIDPLNRISTYTYDSLGNVTGLANPDGTKESYTYNSDSEVLTATNENGGVTSYTYLCSWQPQTESFFAQSAWRVARSANLGVLRAA
jgi:YD repeat-containing protein